MPISIDCPACGADYKVPESLLGKTIRCKACAGAIKVPLPKAEDEEEYEDDEPESDGEAPVRRKNGKRRKPPGNPNAPLIIVGMTVGVILIAGLTLYFVMSRAGNDRVVVVNGAAPNLGGIPAVPAIPNQPNNGQRITDPDQLIAGKYPQGPDKFTLDPPQKGRLNNGVDIGYAIIDPKLLEEAAKRKGPGNRPGRVVMFDPVFVVVASEGNIRESLLAVSWESKGVLTVRGFGKDIPSGARICLAVNGTRVSNVVTAP